VRKLFILYQVLQKTTKQYKMYFCSWEPPSQEGALGVYCIAAEKH